VGSAPCALRWFACHEAPTETVLLFANAYSRVLAEASLECLATSLSLIDLLLHSPLDNIWLVALLLL
jgi:hypothetical protein